MNIRGLVRLVLAAGVTAALAALVRFRGRGGVPPRTGGWRELGDLSRP